MDKQQKTRITEKLRELKHQPEAGKQLKHSKFRRLRIGDYSAIYENNEDKNQVVILHIGHRKNVYDDFTKLF